MARIGNEKISFIIIAVLCFMCTVLLFGVGIQTARVSEYEYKLGQYRTAAQQFTEYQQSVDDGLQSARECISSATGSVYELREGLRTLEKIFIDLENDNNNLRSYISSIDTNYSNEEKLK